MLLSLDIPDFKLDNGKELSLSLSYETFGQPLDEAPIVLVNHALTGNSSVSGENGWWKSLIGHGKIIDTQKFCVLTFNIPGNGYDGQFFDNYSDFCIKDIAKLFLKGLNELKIKQLHSIIGASLGGAIAWQMAFLQTSICKNLIPIATDYIATDWVISQCYLQDLILNNTQNAVHNARVHAMLTYRYPTSLNQRFKRETKEGDSSIYKSEDWLDFHGNRLAQRFDKRAYLLMNHLMRTIAVSKSEKELSQIKANIHVVGIDSDLLFTPDRNRQTHKSLAIIKENIFYHEIVSVHGHDAFLIENKQLDCILKPIFT